MKQLLPRIVLLTCLLVIGLVVGRWLNRELAPVEVGASPSSESAPIVQAAPEPVWQPQSTKPIEYPRGASRGELLVYFEDEASYRAYLAELERAGLRPKGQIDGLLTVRLDEGTLRSHFPESGEVKVGYSYDVQPPLPPEALNPVLLSQLRAYGVSAAQIVGELESTGEGVRVAILDSGLMEHHQFRESDIEVLDYTEAGVDGEGAGHGTSVASIIGGMEGIAPDATLMVMRVLGADGVGNSFTVASAIVDAVDAGADIVNLSLGLYVDTPVLRNAVAYAEQQGVLLVAAAGNDGYANLAYPAAYESVIAVTAVDASGAQAIFPNQSTKIDFAAPGVGILTAKDEQGTTLFTGTSAAVPFISGTLATMLASDTSRLPQESVNILAETLNEAGAPGVDPLYGAGVVDWQRMRERDESDIVDVAVASVYLSSDALPGTNIPVEVVVQNRGTEWLYDAELEIQLGEADPQAFKLEALAPGKTATRQVTALLPSDPDEAQLRVVATVLPEEKHSDLRLENNFKAVQFVPNE